MKSIVNNSGVPNFHIQTLQIQPCYDYEVEKGRSLRQIMLSLFHLDPDPEFSVSTYLILVSTSLKALGNYMQGLPLNNLMNPGHNLQATSEKLRVVCLWTFSPESGAGIKLATENFFDKIWPHDLG